MRLLLGEIPRLAGVGPEVVQLELDEPRRGDGLRVPRLHAPRGLEFVQEVARLGLPVIAIGGLETFDLVAGTGAGADEIEVTTTAASAWTQVATTLLPRFLAVTAPVGGGERLLTTGSGDNGSGGTIPDLTAETYLP